MSLQLPENIYSEIVARVNRAKAGTVAEEYEEALDQLRQAENIFPQPAEQYAGACMLYCLMAEVHLQLQQEEEAFKQLKRAEACADGVNDAKINYLLGLYHLHRDEEQPAITYFEKAYQAGGEEVFASRTEKDRTFFKQHIFRRKTITNK